MDPLNVQPAPESPMGPPQQQETPNSFAPAPESPMGPAMSQEEMRANMQSAMGQLDSKYSEFNSKKFALGNRDQESKGELLREIFAYFESVGVDPSNPKEVNDYLENLKTENPELSQQIESVLESVLGPEITDQAPSDQVPEDMNINKYENLQQNL